MREQLATLEAMSNPRAGKKLFDSNDARWPGSDGWGKYARNVNGIVIHYQFNSRTGQIDDFKIK